MSRGFLSTLGGLAVTIFSWFSPWSWPAWPALTLLSVVSRPNSHSGRAAFVVALIVVNTAFWSLVFYAMTKPWARRISALCLLLSALNVNAATEKAMFAGGCFWSMESDLEKVSGVLNVVSGYVAHRETVEVTYDPAKISYPKLVETYWHSIDPLDKDGQFCDTGEQYHTAIFYLNEAQKRAAEASKANVVKKLGGAYTTILPASAFEAAGKDDQDYAKRNPVKYKFYRFNCGRDDRLKQLWGSAAGR